MVYDKASEEALLLGLGSDIEQRDSLESGIDGNEKSFSEYPTSHLSWLRRVRRRACRARLARTHRREASRYSARSPSRRTWLIRLLLMLKIALGLAVALLVVVSTMFPSYTYPPAHYAALRQDIASSNAPGRANPRNETVFIAASLYEENGNLVSGEWGRLVVTLIDLLGPENVFLSLYENDPDHISQKALDAFRTRLPCKSSVVDEHIDWNEFDRVLDLNGTQHLKRIAMLAEVRNRALQPLDDPSSEAYHTRWDKLLYLNDVIFDPVEAVNLLFSTNINFETGKTDYRAACAVDFVNPFKFYDTYATRDSEGFGMGVPIYPWFTPSGSGQTRRTVLMQKDAVPVKSCWGGMTAFEAKWFQPYIYRTDDEPPRFNEMFSPYAPLRFRSEPDIYWDASECCLIHGDLAFLSGNYDKPGIYMNPYVRVAYSFSAFRWQALNRRVERVYIPFQWVLNWIADLPDKNERRLQQPGEEVVDKTWQWNDDYLKAVQDGTVAKLGPGPHGAYKEIKTTAKPGQFCGVREQSVIKNADEYHGGQRWQKFISPGY